MDYEKKPSLPEDDSWLDSILDAPVLGSELGPDEQAVLSAGLTHPDDLELESIIQESKSDQWDSHLSDAGIEPEPILEEPAAPETVEELPNPIPDSPVEHAVTDDATRVIPLGTESLREVLPTAQTDDAPETFPDSSEISALDSAELAEIGFDTSVFEDEEFQEPLDADFFLSAAFDEQPEETDAGGYDAEESWALPEMMTKEDEALTEDPVEDSENEETPALPMKKKTVPAAAKVRPKMKKNYGLFGLPHLLSSVIWLAIIVGIGVSLGRVLWVCAAEVLAFGKAPTTVTITITQEDMDAENTLELIAGKLERAGLIEHPELFLWYAKLTDAEEEITAGTYALRGTDDYMALVNSMNSYSSARETVEVMVPEGYTSAQIFALLEEKGVCTAEALEQYAAEGEFKDYWFLEGVERGTKHCLEGYLFPDTYEFYVGDDPGRVLGKMLGDSVGGFDVRFTDIMEEKLVTLNETLSAMMRKNGYGQDYIDAHQVTIREVVIIASMIEKETTGTDRYDIASVIYNRLTNAKSHPYLNIDATILYALGGKVDPVTGENLPLTEADMKLDNPFNTYLYKGLPPGPISNPGVYSLLAALDPNDTAYYYYVYDPSIRAHHFSKTYEEHQRYIDRMG